MIWVESGVKVEMYNKELMKYKNSNKNKSLNGNIQKGFREILKRQQNNSLNGTI